MKTATTSRNIARSLSMGILISMVFFYAVHVFGNWKVENYRPDPETTGSILLHNTCAVFGREHTLRPNTDVSGMGESINGTKLAASFMNFIDGHITGMILLAVALGAIVFFVRRKKQRP